MEKDPAPSWVLLTKHYHCTWRSKSGHSVPEKAHSNYFVRHREISDCNSRACLREWPGQTLPLASSSSHSDSSECSQTPDWEIQSSLLPCSSFITCWSSSMLPIWQDWQFIINLILKSRCTASKPPGLSHMEMPSGLLLLQCDPVTQLFPSRSTECQDKVKLVTEGGGNSHLLFLLP